MTKDLKTAIADALQAESDEGGGYEDLAQAALQAIHDAGWVIVPREPNEAMLQAADRTRDATWPSEPRFETLYRAMTQAASQPNTEDKPK